MKKLHMVTFILLIIGGLNWGLQAFDFNLVEKLLGSWPTVVQIVYIFVGLSAVVELVNHKKDCKSCA